MATTTNFGWETPDDTDLVKDGALAIRTLGSAIDTSLVDLKGGTTGQVLSKTSNTDMDFTWVTSDDANAIQNAIVDAKGDLITATAADTPARLAVGTNGQVLTADSTTATGLKWAATAAGGSLIKITAGSFSNVATVDIDSVFTNTYDVYLATVNIRAATSSDAAQIQFRYGSTTLTSGYYASQFQYNRTNALSTNGSDNLSQAVLSSECGNAADTSFNANIYFTRVGISSSAPTFWGNGVNYQSNQSVVTFGGIAYDATPRTFSGFRLKSSSSNITGSYVIYGLAK